MIIFDFIYFCIYSFVPDKAIFGKRDVACTFFSSFSAFLILGIWIYCERTFRLYELNAAFLVIALFGGLFLLIRKIYLNPKKIRYIHKKFRQLPKWLLKTIGIFYSFLCFASFIILGSIASLK